MFFVQEKETKRKNCTYLNIGCHMNSTILDQSVTYYFGHPIHEVCAMTRISGGVADLFSLSLLLLAFSLLWIQPVV